MPKKSQDKYDHLVKILLLGDSSVGKSSLLLRFCEKKFGSNYTLTIGIDFETRIVENRGKRYKLQIWDTAGQERFRTITPAYFRSAMGVILVYDITSIESFESLDYWTGILDEYSRSDLVKVVVGNKLDLYFARQVDEYKGKSFADQIGAPFFELSAKNNHSNVVDEPFLVIIEKLINSGQFLPLMTVLDGKHKKKRKFVLSKNHDSNLCRLKSEHNIDECLLSGNNDAGDIDDKDGRNQDNQGKLEKESNSKMSEKKQKDKKNKNMKEKKKKSEDCNCDSSSSFSSLDGSNYKVNLNSKYQECC
ncbi:Ras family SEC4 [Cryptosporidium xiaoi]|uniref:Ras family SEC4 n=1 Tax=Cryptosporidium xiaoi TaxID=659607 RepID=A0AAV9XZ13_9CRYT